MSWNYIGEKETPTTFPEKDEGYEVTDVVCTNGEGIWDNVAWGIRVANLTGSSKCTITFDDGPYKDDSGANAPELIEGLIPVIWNGSNWVKADLYDKWYDYDEQMWANAVTVTSASRSEYNSAAANTVISMDDIETMWVWIPRYSYTIKGSEQIEFVNNNTNRHSTTATSTFTFTPTEDGVFEFTYDIESESCCDKFTASLNGTNLVNSIGGTYTGQKVSTNVTAGIDYTLTLQYKKDSSVNTGTDTVTVYNMMIPGVDVNALVDTSTTSYKFTKENELKYYGQSGYGGNLVSKATPGAIDIKFIDRSTKELGSAQYTESIPENWRTPDGFTFGNEELSGIWIAKFETSSTNPSASNGGGNTTSYNPLVKPNVISWRNITVSNAFTVSRKLTADNNRYGLDTNADGHMMKSSEWGLVAYLSQSKYGKYGNTDYVGTNKEIYKNNSSSHYTGRSEGISPPTDNYSSNGTYTYSVEGSGTGASTTGTIYGIYDMNGNSWEYMMGNYNRNISTSAFSSLPDSKYYDLYTTTVYGTACNGGVCYGHALSETLGWYNDYDGVLSSSNPWSLRGGYYLPGDSGIFYLHAHGGATNVNDSFRLSLTP